MISKWWVFSLRQNVVIFPTDLTIISSYVKKKSIM